MSMNNTGAPRAYMYVDTSVDPLRVQDEFADPSRECPGCGHLGAPVVEFDTRVVCEECGYMFEPCAVVNDRDGATSSAYTAGGVMGAGIVVSRYHDGRRTTERLNRMLTWFSVQKEEATALAEFVGLCEAHGISRRIATEAHDIFAKFREENDFAVKRKKERRAILGACIFHACGNAGSARTCQEIAEIVHCDTQILNQKIAKVALDTDQVRRSILPSHLIVRVADATGLFTRREVEYAHAAQKTVEAFLEKQGLMTTTLLDKNVNSLVAAVVQTIYCTIHGTKSTTHAIDEKIASASNIGQATFKKMRSDRAMANYFSWVARAFRAVSGS